MTYSMDIMGNESDQKFLHQNFPGLSKFLLAGLCFVKLSLAQASPAKVYFSAETHSISIVRQSRQPQYKLATEKLVDQGSPFFRDFKYIPGQFWQILLNKLGLS